QGVGSALLNVPIAVTENRRVALAVAIVITRRDLVAIQAERLRLERVGLAKDLVPSGGRRAEHRKIGFPVTIKVGDRSAGRPQRILVNATSVRGNANKA